MAIKHPHFLISVASVPHKRFSLLRYTPLLRNTLSMFQWQSKWLAVALCCIAWHSFTRKQWIAKRPLFSVSIHKNRRKI